MPPPPPPGAARQNAVPVSHAQAQAHQLIRESRSRGESVFLLDDAKPAEQPNAYQGDSSFITLDPSVKKRRANRYRPWRRRKWLMQFTAASAILILLAGTFLSVLDRGWSKLRAALVGVFPDDTIIDEVQEPIIDSVEMVSISETEIVSRYDIQREALGYEDELP